MLKINLNPPTKLFAVASLVAGAMVGAQAATATSSTIPVQLTVNAPTCSISNSSGAVYTLPGVSTMNTTWSAYLTANSINAAGTNGGTWVTSSSLNQTATISCDTANTIITSFLVQPGSSASLSGVGVQYLVDSASGMAANGDAQMVFEQVAVNGTPAAQVYTTGGALVPYATPFLTGALSAGTSTATVVWRPEFISGSATPVGNPTGGIYKGYAQIVANY